MIQYMKNKFIDLFFWVFRLLDRKYPAHKWKTSDRDNLGITWVSQGSEGKYTGHHCQNQGGIFSISVSNIMFSYEHWCGTEYFIVRYRNHIIKIIDIA